MSLVERQKADFDTLYAAGTREHIALKDPLVDYTTYWRLREAFRRLRHATPGRIRETSNILVMCAGDGADGSVLCDMGYQNVTVSDISDMGVAAALARDSRLAGLVLNAQNAQIEDGAFDVVVVQDGLHHLPSPIQGFTEMLRIASIGAVFLEPHDSLVGRVLGTKWERNGEATNYVFRWTRKLVHDVACSYFGSDSFQNLSFSFWHHNIAYHRLGVMLGDGTRGIYAIRTIKFVLDHVLGRFGNQFCGMVIKV